VFAILETSTCIEVSAAKGSWRTIAQRLVVCVLTCGPSPPARPYPFWCTNEARIYAAIVGDIIARLRTTHGEVLVIRLLMNTAWCFLTASQPHKRSLSESERNHGCILSFGGSPSALQYLHHTSIWRCCPTVRLRYRWRRCYWSGCSNAFVRRQEQYAISYCPLRSITDKFT
jgi:hypothetical protein